VVERGTGRGAALRTARAYGKTGTTSGNADAWFIGWSEARVLAVWMGRRRGETDGPALAGSGPPADLFRRIQAGAIELDAQRRPAERRPDRPVVAESRPPTRAARPRGQTPGST
jgi:penicillin-binding protein 1A